MRACANMQKNRYVGTKAKTIQAKLHLCAVECVHALDELLEIIPLANNALHLTLLQQVLEWDSQPIRRAHTLLTIG